MDYTQNKTKLTIIVDEGQADGGCESIKGDLDGGDR
jgi:hypothetical protein